MKQDEEFQREELGCSGYVNKACWLAKTLNNSPSKRCRYCQLKFKGCIFFQYLIISLVLVSFLFTLSFLVEGEISRLFIISIFLLVITYGYFFNKTTEKIIEAGFAEKKARMALAEFNQKLFKLDQQKTEFLNIAAHQLRTPVSIIKNYVAMLQDGDYGQVSEEVKEVHKNIGTSNEWLVRLADEFLNIANLEQGRERYRFEEVNLVHLIDSVVKELRIRAESKGLKLVWDNNVSFPRRRESSHGIDVALDPRLRGDDTEESNLTIHADPEKLRNVIFNFVDNAIKYSEQGVIKIVVEETSPPPLSFEEREAVDPSPRGRGTQGEGIGVSVRVIDQGIGFDIDDEKVLFQKFQRGERAKKHEANTSTGLGLYIAKMFVEGHGGRVWAKSEGEGKGSEFGFWVPLKQ